MPTLTQAELNNLAVTSQASMVSIMIEPGALYEFNVSANHFYVVNSTGPVNIKSAEFPEKTYRAGTGERLSGNQIFTRLELFNRGTVPIELTVWAGFGEYIDNRAEIVEQYTALEVVRDSGGIPLDILPYQGTIRITGATNGKDGYIQRKALCVSNNAAAGGAKIFIHTDVDGVIGPKCLTVFPATSVRLDCSSPVWLSHDGTSEVSLFASELFYKQAAL